MAEDLRKHLRRITDEAISRALQIDSELAAEEAVRAREITATILARAEDAAREGTDYLVVMDVEYTGRPRLFETGPLSLDPKQLVGASAIVFDFCLQEGLQPKLLGRWEEISDSRHQIVFCIFVSW